MKAKQCIQCYCLLLVFFNFEIKICLSLTNYYETKYYTPTVDTSLPYIFHTESLPDDRKFMPTVGNGHLGFTILSDSVYMNGIYNGHRGLSHRARIPNYSNITLILPKLNTSFSSSSEYVWEPYRISYSLNTLTGIFQIIMENEQIKIVQLIYPHRYYTRAIINQIFVYRLKAKGALRVNIRHEPGQRTEDIDFTQPTTFRIKKAKITKKTSSSSSSSSVGTRTEETASETVEKFSTSNTMMRMKTMKKLISPTTSRTSRGSSNGYYSSTASVYEFTDDDGDDDDDDDDDDDNQQQQNNENVNEETEVEKRRQQYKNEEKKTMMMMYSNLNSIPLSSSSSLWPSYYADDITTKTTMIRDNETLIHMIQGYTKEVEDDSYQKSRKHVCCLWNHVPEHITLYEDQRSASYRFVMTTDELCSVAQQEMTDVLSTSNKKLIKSHRNEWIQFWNNFNITVTDNLKLGKAIYGSIFYLVSSLPSIDDTNQPKNLYYGLSPTGLGRGGKNLEDYEGHSFWDTEIWMLPVITQMNPKWTRILLNYRYRMLDVAKDNAKKYKYYGSKFPWESAFTGTEVTQPCCPLVALQQHHITADIGYALQNYFSMTYDLEWLHNEGCALADNIAEFWSSRVEKDPLSGLYDIKYVMGPDEDHPNVTNNVYTNVIAGYALKFGEFVRSICNDGNSILSSSSLLSSSSSSSSSDWLNIAENLKVLYDGNLDYHPQFEGYDLNDKIKQADAVLLGYPLLFPMKDSTKRNDLRIYEKVTRHDGPAMTWSIHSINHLDIGDYLKADKNFEKSYENYIQAPFQVWSETVDGNGATNFLTGAGGFLQSIINGYAGIRYYLDRMEIKKPRIPPNSNSFKISGIKYLGSVFKISVGSNESLLQCTFMNKMQPLILQDNYDEFEISTNFIYHIKSTKIIIKPTTEQFEINSIYGRR